MLVNNFNCFYNKQVKKDNPHFGALKIDSAVLANVDFYKEIKNLDYVKKIAEELKDTKFYDLHVKYTGHEYKSFDCRIIDRTRQDIDKSIDKHIYAPLYEGYLTSNRNFIVVNYVSGHHCSRPEWWYKSFEVGTEKEAEKLVDNFSSANQVRKIVSKSDDVENIYKTRLNAYAKYIKVLEAIKAYSYKRNEVDQNVMEYVNKNLKDCII